LREWLGAGAILVVWVRGDWLLHGDEVDDIVVVGTAQAQPGDGESQEEEEDYRRHQGDREDHGETHFDEFALV
jgi:hypothetical protein